MHPDKLIATLAPSTNHNLIQLRLELVRDTWMLLLYLLVDLFNIQKSSIAPSLIRTVTNILRCLIKDLLHLLHELEQAWVLDVRAASSALFIRILTPFGTPSTITTRVSLRRDAQIRISFLRCQVRSAAQIRSDCR